MNSQSRSLRVPQPKVLQALTLSSLPPHLSLPNFYHLIALHDALGTPHGMNSIDQTIFRGQTSFPGTIQVRHVSQAHVGDACRHLQSGGASTSLLPIGIAYHIDSEGKIDFMCLSNQHLAFVISFDHYYNDKPHPSTHFADFLHSRDDVARRNEPEICLVGFSFPRTAIHVNRVTQRHVRGVDLSTMFSPNPREPWSPSRIVKERVHSSANTWDIACLWLGDERTAERNTCLQAWLSAWYVLAMFNGCESVSESYYRYPAVSPLAALMK